MGEPVPVYDEWSVNGYEVQLYKDGRFLFRKAHTKQQFKPADWYRDSKTGRPWIPKKRRSFISAVKQMIREGDFE